jgi:multiple sugar transport system ATP-binding protein
VTFGVRPENLLLEPGAPAEARVFDIEDQGVIKVLTIDMGGTRLHATVPAGTRVARDEVVRFGWKPERVLTFDTETGANLAVA